MSLFVKFSVSTTLLTKAFTITMSYSNRLNRYQASHLGSLSLLLREYEECIAGQEAGQGDIQEPEVLPEQIY